MSAKRETSTRCLLVGDIGGTNARFALADVVQPGFSREKTYRCADFASADLAIRAYLKNMKCGKPEAICIAAAGPIVDGAVRFTNNHWTIDASDLQTVFDIDGVSLLNDFEAIAYSIPWLGDNDLRPVGLRQTCVLAEDDFTVGIIGPGTGLGVAGLCRRAGRVFPIVGEGGHVGFAAESQVQVQILSLLRERFDRVSDERLVSGPGIENIYWALGRIREEKQAQLSAAEVFTAAAERADETATETVQLFFEILGQVAGNLALTLGASDGIYLAGGIVRRYPELIVNSRFRSAFENKGRHRSLVENISTQLILHPQPGLLGASFCALELAKRKH